MKTSKEKATSPSPITTPDKKKTIILNSNYFSDRQQPAEYSEFNIEEKIVEDTTDTDDFTNTQSEFTLQSFREEGELSKFTENHTRDEESIVDDVDSDAEDNNSLEPSALDPVSATTPKNIASTSNRTSAAYNPFNSNVFLSSTATTIAKFEIQIKGSVEKRSIETEGTITRNSKPYIAYIIQAMATYNNSNSKKNNYNCTWVVLRRFNEFKVLDAMIRKLLPKTQQTLVPELPLKTTMIGAFSEDFVNQRKALLQQYIQQILAKLFHLSDIVRDLILSFFGVESSPISYVQDRSTFMKISKWIPQSNNVDDKFLDYYKQVRMKKSKIKCQQEELRQSLHQFENEKHHAQIEITSFYDKYYKKNDQLKQEVLESRLEGDVFLVEFRNSPFIFNISSQSKVFLYPAVSPNQSPNNGSTTPTSQDKILIDLLASLSFDEITDDSLLSKEEVRFKSTTGGSTFFIDSIVSVSPVHNTFKGDGLEGVLIELKQNSILIIYTYEKNELTEVLGAFMTKMKKQKLALIPAISNFIKDKDVKYDAQNPAHENMLMELWNTIFPKIQLKSRKSKQWEALGFQGEDPATDFRAMGILGLRMVLVFAKRYTNEFKRILEADRGYPLSCSCINIVHALVQMLQPPKVRTPKSPTSPNQDVQMQNSQWNEDLFNLLCLHKVEQFNYIIEEIFCLSCLLLDRIWMERNATYMQYQEVISDTKRRLQSVFAKRPSSIETLKFLMDRVN